MTYTKEDKKRYLILQCRYYKGESEPPKTLPEGYALMWDYESRWVDWTLNEDKMVNHFENDIRDLHLETKEGDKTPLTLKALLCNRYLHWGGGYAPLEEELKNFEKWYVDFYQMWKTNREHRADKRKPGLVAKCRYYQGEKENPWNDCRDGILLWRAHFWDWERVWVDGMSNSYNFKPPFDPHDMCNIPKDLHVKYNIPRTLLNYILAVHIGNLSHNAYTVISGTAMERFIQDFYLKYTPLNGECEKYFGFYYGGEIEFEKGTSQGLFAYIEQMFHENSEKHLSFIEPWIEDARHLKATLQPEECKFCDIQKIPIQRLAVAIYIEAMVGKWCPYENLEEIDIEYIRGVQDLSKNFYQI